MKTKSNNENEHPIEDPMSEFHDIGKIFDWKSIGMKSGDHEFQLCISDNKWREAQNFSSNVWRGIFYKDTATSGRQKKGIYEFEFNLREIKQLYWPNDFSWLWTSIADQLAAGFGRALPESTRAGLPSSNGLKHCLWTGQDTVDPRLNNENQFHDFLSFLNSSPTWDNAKTKFKTQLCDKPEHANQGVNVTSLLAHCETTGKIARVLSRLAFVPFAWNDSWASIEPKLNAISFTIAQIEVEIIRRPFRVADWNIFAQRRELLQKISSDHPDNVLGINEAELFAVSLAGDETLNQIVAKIEQAGFRARGRICEKTPVDQLLKKESGGLLGALRDVESRVIYASPNSLPARIELPICEACQMAHAEKRWPADSLALRDNLSSNAVQILKSFPWKELGENSFAQEDWSKLGAYIDEEREEDLCDRCFKLRRESTKLEKLRAWPNQSVAWVYVHANLENIRAALVHLQREYLHPNVQGNAAAPEEILKHVFAAWPLIADFLDAHKAFLSALKARWDAAFGEDHVEAADENLWCILLGNNDGALRLLDLYHSLFREYFPKLMEVPESVQLPIRLAVSISSRKHPFFVHWRFLEHPVADIAIQLAGSGQAGLALARLPQIHEALRHCKRHALHRLAGISRTSPALAAAVMNDGQDRDRASWSALNGLAPKAISFETLRILGNLTAGADPREEQDNG